MQTILLVGNDPGLLKSRAAVLNQTGFITVCSIARKAIAVQTEVRAELVVLCHTVPEQTAVALTRSLHEGWRSTRVLQVLTFGQQKIEGYSTVADSVSDCHPECLLQAVRELLGPVTAPPVECSHCQVSPCLQ